MTTFSYKSARRGCGTGLRRRASARARRTRCISQEKTFNLKLSDNEVYFTNALLLLIKIMLRSKLHDHKVLD